MTVVPCQITSADGQLLLWCPHHAGSHPSRASWPKPLVTKIGTISDMIWRLKMRRSLVKKFESFVVKSDRPDRPSYRGQSTAVRQPHSISSRNIHVWIIPRREWIWNQQETSLAMAIAWLTSSRTPRQITHSAWTARHCKDSALNYNMMGLLY